MTIREWLKALTQISTEYEDCLDRELEMDFDDEDGVYHRVVGVGITRDFGTGEIVASLTEAGR